MSAIFASVRVCICALASGLVLLCQAGASAQELPGEKITGADIRRALIWTGHYSAFADGDPLALVTKAAQAWQKSKNYAVTETLPSDQVDELLSEGMKQREAVGWAILQDKSVGFSVGVPTRLVKFVGTHTQNMARVYDFEGSVGYALLVRYGDWHCGSMNTLYLHMLRQRPFFRARGSDWIALGEDDANNRGYERIICRPSGAVVASVGVLKSQLAVQGPLFAAMAESLSLSRFFNPTALPRPKLDEVPPSAEDFQTTSATRPHGAGPLRANVDGSGKTAALKREMRDGPDLSVQEVFEKVSGAVYVVKVDKRMGSAVAISDSELLTNCHVVGESTRVTLVRDKTEQEATVISMNAEADRCVLKTEAKLAKWVSIRPYDDIKVGERALTIGTPQGLELTVAEGVVSSKRTHKGSRLIQTSAPISQGSSGGGLFDAQGHLLGITTFYFKAGQNLNFAVAAEEFAK